MNSHPRRSAPVPDSDCAETMRFSVMAGLLAPKSTARDSSQNFTSPLMSRYSWFRDLSAAMAASAFLTTSRIRGLSSSVLKK